jgi:hypothetical protein
MDRRWWLGGLFAAMACGGSPDDPPKAGGEATADTSASVPGTTVATAATALTGMTGLWTLTACTGTPGPDPDALADVEAVSMQGGPDDWTVSVTVRSPDVDCDQYADWWEILTPDGDLVHRRILNHSHADEQPFTRSSEGSVTLDAATTYRVRAHLHPTGFGGQVMEGRPGSPFVAVEVPDDWAAELSTAEPLPDDCWF